MNLDAALDFLDFVTERHRIWAARQAGLPQPWTEHPILANHKFTNVYRVIDPGSQFVVDELDEPGLDGRDLLMRLFLYRHTGRIEAWEYLKQTMGAYPLVSTLDDAEEVFKLYRGNPDMVMGKTRWAKVEQERPEYPRKVFTNAYVVTPFSGGKGSDKLESLFRVARTLFADNADLVTDILTSSTQAERYAVLRRAKGLGDFMSMQILTDWGYTTEFREDEFVVCGPGAVNGSRALGGRARDIHPWAVQAVRALPDCPTWAGRLPSWMDVQNLLCEFSKFVRFQQDIRKGTPYAPAHPGPQPTPTIPRRW